MTSAFSPAQQQRASALYRGLVRTTRALFKEDAHAVAAARAEIRRQFLQARQERDATKIDEGLDMGEQSMHMLKHNVVQGVAERDSETYKLGDNATVKSRKPAPSRGQVSRTQGRRAVRTDAAPISTLARHTAPVREQIRSFTTSRFARASDSGAPAPLPRPVPRFPGIVILADGSSIQLTTTSPRHLTRLTRDYTNHPLWNTSMGNRSDADAEDDTGRLGRFRRRFAEESSAESAGAPAVSFDEGDLDWMSGGREALAGTPLATGKKKGKGKK
ncbi:hypothetical protein MSPP1_003916 [Malassezia sp. CBS 17886]|nr:hypothetical protein MSPP1_003916 [Malassezia sp. CBS 17886]